MDTNQARLNIWLLEKRSLTSFMRFLRVFLLCDFENGCDPQAKIKGDFLDHDIKNIALIWDC